MLPHVSLSKAVTTVVLAAALVHAVPGAQGHVTHAQQRVHGWQDRTVCAWIQAIHEMRGDDSGPCAR
jgi:hypothetical protein